MNSKCLGTNNKWSSRLCMKISKNCTAISWTWKTKSHKSDRKRRKRSWAFNSLKKRNKCSKLKSRSCRRPSRNMKLTFTSCKTMFDHWSPRTKSLKSHWHRQKLNFKSKPIKMPKRWKNNRSSLRLCMIPWMRKRSNSFPCNSLRSRTNRSKKRLNLWNSRSNSRDKNANKLRLSTDHLPSKSKIPQKNLAKVTLRPA